jgi:hypothetical protein
MHHATKPIAAGITALRSAPARRSAGEFFIAIFGLAIRSLC